MTLDAPRLLCICDEEWCYCAELVDEPDTSCAECLAGAHVWEPFGDRSPSV